MRYIYLTLLVIAGILVGAGCASTGNPSNAALGTTAQADGIEKWERRSYSAASVGTAFYLMKRDDLAVKQREAIRQTWLAYHAIVVSLKAQGVESIDVQTALIDAVEDHITDEALRPLAIVFIQTVIDGIKANVPVDKLTASDSWRIAVAVHNGIANTLVLHGVDPSKPVKGSNAGDRT
jgi:hypothetical protein